MEKQKIQMIRTFILIVVVCIGFCALTSKFFMSPIVFAEIECLEFCGTPDPTTGGGVGDITPLIGGCGGLE